MRTTGATLLLSVVLLIHVSPVEAQRRTDARDGWGINLTVDDYGLAIGNVPRVNGLRINLRDSYLESINGIALGLVAEEGRSGLSVGGLATVTGSGNMTGINVGGLATVAGEGEIHGLSIAAWNDAKKLQVGLSVGLYNSTDELHGIQLGLLNRAGNNRSPFRYVPLLNAHFD